MKRSASEPGLRLLVVRFFFSLSLSYGPTSVEGTWYRLLVRDTPSLAPISSRPKLSPISPHINMISIWREKQTASSLELWLRDLKMKEADSLHALEQVTSYQFPNGLKSKFLVFLLQILKWRRK